MEIVGKFMGEIEFTGILKHTTIKNGMIIHEVQLKEPITHFGYPKTELCIKHEDLYLGQNNFVMEL